VHLRLTSLGHRAWGFKPFHLLPFTFHLKMGMISAFICVSYKTRHPLLMLQRYYSFSESKTEYQKEHRCLFFLAGGNSIFYKIGRSKISVLEKARPLALIGG